jgi:hypothetical protein
MAGFLPHSPLHSGVTTIGTLPGVLVADTEEELRQLAETGFQDDQHRLKASGVCRDCYDGNFYPYISSWIGADKAREIACRYSMIMRRTVDVLSMHLYRKGPKRYIADNPLATKILNRIYKANDFDSLMQLADRTTYVTDVAAIEFVPNDGPDAARVPVKMRLWDASEFVPVFSSVDAMQPIAIATMSTQGKQRTTRIFTPEFVTKYATDSPAYETSYAQRSIPTGGMKEVLGYPQPNYLGTIPFEFVHYEMPKNSFWVSGVGRQLAHLNLHVNRRLCDLADQIIGWRPKGVLVNTKADWNFPQDQKPGQYARLESTGGPNADKMQAIAQFIGPDLAFTQYDWNDLTAYIDHLIEMLGVPASVVRMQQQGGTSGAAIQSEQLPLIERAEARQRLFESIECKIAKKTIEVALAQMMAALPPEAMAMPIMPTVDEMGMPIPMDPALAEIQNALAEIQALQMAQETIYETFRMAWPVLTKNRPGPDRDAHDMYQLNSMTNSRTQMLAEDRNIPEEEAFGEIMKTFQYIQQENMGVAAAQAPLMPPPAPEGEEGGQNPPPEEQGGESDG